MPDWSKRNARALLKEFQRHGQATDVHISDFRGENLQGEIFDLSEELAGADFRKADLIEARFPRGADLTGVDLGESLLVGAVLDGTDLSGADLRGAVLDRASLIGADLAGARVEGASWHRARLVGAVLPPLDPAASWGAALPGRSPRLEIGRCAPIDDLAVRPQNDLLAVARGSRVEIWDLTAGLQLGAPIAHAGGVTAVAWSPDGQLLASVGRDGRCLVWAAGAAELVREFPGGGPAHAVTWSPDGTSIAVADDQGVAVRDAKGGLRLELTGGSWAVAWSPDGRTLATGDIDQAVRVWDAPTGEPVHTFAGHRGRVHAVAWSPGGHRLASCGDDGHVRVWDSNGVVFTLPHPQGINAMAWSPDGGRIGAAGRGGGAWVWDAVVRNLLNSLPGDGAALNAITWSPDGERLIRGGEDGRARIWDETLAVAGGSLVGHDQRVWALAWSPDGATLACAGPGEIRMWDTIRGESAGLSAGHPVIFWALAWSPDGARLAGCGSNGRIHVLDAATGDLSGPISEQVDGCSMAWSPDGRELACGCEDGLIRIWHTGRETFGRALESHRGRVMAVAWSPDGRTLAGADEDGAITVWDVGRSARIALLKNPAGPVRSLVWSPDGRTLTSAAPHGELSVWDVTALLPPRAGSRRWPHRTATEPDTFATSSQAFDLTPPGAVECLAISPDGGRVAMALDDESVALLPIGEPDPDPLRLLALPHGGWAAFHGDHTYRLHGDPAARFWWSAGLCRFEPGDLDANGITRLDQGGVP